MKDWQIALAIFASLSASLAVADDFKTVSGKEYKNAIVSRVEADGVVIRTKRGISKIYFIELPKDVQERFHYHPAQDEHVTADARGNGGTTKCSVCSASSWRNQLINSLLGMVRQTIRPFSTRISHCWRERFITPIRTKAGEFASRLCHPMVLLFGWSIEDR